MSSSVCQGLQSCLEPGFIEPRAVFDKLAPPRSNFSQSIPWPQKPNVSQEQQEQIDNSSNENKMLILNKFSFNDGKHQSNKNGDMGWSFMQALANTSRSGKQVARAEEEQVYVHPLARRSSSSLSTQSLEMCTESLGSETGSNNDGIMADLSCLSREKQGTQGGIQRLRSRENFTKKLERNGTFPPPLTLISGSDGIQLRPHREGGRLVLKAVTFCHRSCFQAERTNGRLRLFSLSKDEFGQYEDDKHGEELEHENFEEEQDFSEEDTHADARDYGVEIEDDVKSSYTEEESTNGKLECEIETEEIPRPRRCKEDGPRNRGMISWEPFWVEIS